VPQILVPVAVATTTANITLSGLQTIDGYTLVAGDRVLVWVQDDLTANGIYLASAGAWTRAADAPDAESMWDCFVWTQFNGNVNYSTLFVNLGFAANGDDTSVTWVPTVSNNWSYVRFDKPGFSEVGTHGTLTSWRHVAIDESGNSPYPWAVEDGYEWTGARPAPADGTVGNSQVFNYYDATNGAAKFVRKGKTADGTLVKNVSRLSPSGALITAVNAAPADSELNAGEMAIWFDSTNGASKLMVKAKSANGTVVVGNVALT
jgi:hypothetical protein